MKLVPFGHASNMVSAVGLGGEGVLRTFDRLAEARAVIHAAIDQGITYFDSARVYSDSEVYLGSVWKEDPSRRKRIFQTSKSATRHKDGALADLKSSLQRLNTDYLDLWQIHDVRSEEDLRQIEGAGGALEAFVQAKQEGLVRYIGVTGHHDPYILTRAVQQWPLDAVLLPVNPVEGLLGGFLTETCSAAKKKGMAIIGMKVLGAGHYIMPKMNISAEKLIQYALSYDITLPIIGCAFPEEVNAVAAAQQIEPLTAIEKKRLEDQFKSYVTRLAFYRGVL